ERLSFWLRGGQAEPLGLGVDREDPDRDAGAGRPGLLMRETGTALRLDERAERHLLGHHALDDVTRLMTREEFLPAHEDHLLPSRALCMSLSLVVTGGGPRARGVIKPWPGNRSVHGPWPTRQSRYRW